MKNKIIEITKDQNHSVIAILEDLLEKAKKNEITQMAVMYSNGNNFDIETSESLDLRSLLSDLEIIKYHAIEEMLS